MTLLASPAQLRASFLRWALVLAPGILLIGFLSGRLANSGVGNPWFNALEKPSLFPPPAAFGIVWSILYLLMGIALALIVTARGARGRRAAIWLFIAQLVLNLAWTPLFFAAHQIAAALVLLIVLDVLVAITLLRFARIRPTAGVLLTPYLAWILFATVLNWQFLQANPAPAQAGETGGVVRVPI